MFKENCIKQKKLCIDRFPLTEKATSLDWDLFAYPSNPEDMCVLWDASISRGLPLQIVTQWQGPAFVYTMT